MKKLLINRKKFINWYLGDSDDVMEFTELFGVEDELASTGSFGVTALSILESVIKFANYLPEKVLADDQDYELNHNDDVVVEGYDLITFDSKWVVCGYCKGEPVPEEDKEDCECPTCNGDGGWLKVETEPVQISGVSTDDLKKELEARGYFTDNLWHINDVKSELASYNQDRIEEKTLDDTECLVILESAMTNQWLIEQIFQLIYNEISE